MVKALQFLSAVCLAFALVSAHYSDLQVFYKKKNELFRSAGVSSNSLYAASFDNFYSITENPATLDIGYFISEEVLDPKAEPRKRVFTNSMSCWTSMPYCVVAGTYQTFTIKLDPTNSTKAPIEVSKLKLFSPTLNHKVERSVVQVIDNSNYFLFATFEAYGVVRAHYMARSTWTGLKLPDLPKFAAVIGFVVLPGTEFAIINYDGVKQFYQFNVGSMHSTHVTKIEISGLLTGFLSKIGADSTKQQLASAREDQIHVLDLQQKSILFHRVIDTWITASRSIPNSNFLMIAGGRKLMVLNPYVSGAALVTIKFVTVVRDFEYLMKTNTFIVIGDETVSVYPGSPATDPDKCHQSCQTCTRLLSSYFCSTCASNYQLVDGECVFGGVTQASIMEAKYKSLEWLEDNQFGFYFDKDAFDKKYEFYATLGFILAFLLALTWMTSKYCLFNWELWYACCCCCKKKSPEDQEKDKSDKDSDSEEDDDESDSNKSKKNEVEKDKPEAKVLVNPDEKKSEQKGGQLEQANVQEKIQSEPLDNSTMKKAELAP